MLLSQILLGLRWNTLNILENLCFCKILNYANMDGPESQIHAINGFIRLRKKEPIMTCIWSAKQRCCSLLNDLRWCTAIARPWNLRWCAEVYKWWGSNDGYPFVWKPRKVLKIRSKILEPHQIYHLVLSFVCSIMSGGDHATLSIVDLSFDATIKVGHVVAPRKCAFFNWKHLKICIMYIICFLYKHIIISCMTWQFYILTPKASHSPTKTLLSKAFWRPPDSAHSISQQRQFGRHPPFRVRVLAENEVVDLDLHKNVRSVEVAILTLLIHYWSFQGSLYYPPKQCTVIGEIPQNYGTLEII